MTGIKPTVSLFRVWQRELDEVLAYFSTTYILYYYGYALALPWSSYYFSHVTHCDCDLWYDHLWPSVTLLWYCDKVMWYFLMLHLAILPSHDTTPLLSFLVPRNFSTTRNMGPPCCPFCLHLPPSILILLIFLPQLLLFLGSSSSSLFLLVSCPSIASNFSLIFPNIPGHIVCPTIHITSLLWTSLVILHAWTSFPCVLATPHLPCLANTLSRILRSLLLHSLNSPCLPRCPTLL